MAQIGTSLLYNQVTVLATERFGDATGAKFFMAWQAVTVVDLSATYFMNSLAVGVAREPQRAAELAAVARKRLLMIFLPLLAIGCVVAGPALWLVFGPEYAEAADVLRLAVRRAGVPARRSCTSWACCRRWAAGSPTRACS